MSKEQESNVSKLYDSGIIFNYTNTQPTTTADVINVDSFTHTKMTGSMIRDYNTCMDISDRAKLKPLSTRDLTTLDYSIDVKSSSISGDIIVILHQDDILDIFKRNKLLNSFKLILNDNKESDYLSIIYSDDSGDILLSTNGYLFHCNCQVMNTITATTYKGMYYSPFKLDGVLFGLIKGNEIDRDLFRYHNQSLKFQLVGAIHKILTLRNTLVVKVLQRDINSHKSTLYVFERRYINHFNEVCSRIVPKRTQISVQSGFVYITIFNDVAELDLQLNTLRYIVFPGVQFVCNSGELNTLRNIVFPGVHSIRNLGGSIYCRKACTKFTQNIRDLVIVRVLDPQHTSEEEVEEYYNHDYTGVWDMFYENGTVFAITNHHCIPVKSIWSEKSHYLQSRERRDLIKHLVLAGRYSHTKFKLPLDILKIIIRFAFTVNRITNDGSPTPIPRKFHSMSFCTTI